MYMYDDEITDLAKLLHVKEKALLAVLEPIPNGDYCTFTLISSLGQQIFRVSYGSFNSVLVFFVAFIAIMVLLIYLRMD